MGQGKAEKRGAFGVAFMLQDFPRKTWRGPLSGIRYNNLFTTNAGDAIVHAVDSGALLLIMSLIGATDSTCRRPIESAVASVDPIPVGEPGDLPTVGWLLSQGYRAQYQTCIAQDRLA